MSNTFGLNPFSTDNSLSSGEFFLGVGDVGKGPTDQTGFWASAPIGTFSYLIALDRGDGIPTFYTCSDDAELILRTNQIDKSEVRTSKEQCFSYFVGQLDKMVVNQDYQNVITDGLVLNLDAGFLPSYPATGNTWYDLNGNQFGGNNGTLTNGPGFNVIGGITLDGQNDYVNIPYAGNTSNSFTFIIVMKCNNMTSDTALNRQTLFGLSQNDNSAFRQFDVEIWGNTGAGFRGDGGSVEGTNFFGYGWTLGVDANNINVYTITLNSTGHSIYVNGTLRNTISQTRTANFDRIWLGRRASDNYWNGICYSFSMYNRILTAQEIKQNYFYSQFDLFRRLSKSDGGLNLAGTYDCLQNRFMNLNSAISATPSMVVVPSFGKSENLYYSVFPNGVGTFSVNLATAGTSKTRVNHRGIIELVGSGIARLDWLGGGCPGLLMESSTTNFARNVSNMTGQDPPRTMGITTSSIDFPAPDGTIGTITKYVGGTSSNQYGYQGLSVTSAGQHTYSIFVKTGVDNPLEICFLSWSSLWNGSSGTNTSFFNILNGTALTPGSSIQDCGDGWYRCIAPPFTIDIGDLNGAIVFGMAEGNNDSSWPLLGALGKTVYIWGAQVEVGTVATSYIPTTSSAVSRSADILSAVDVSNLIGQTQGTLYVEVDLRDGIRDTVGGNGILQIATGASTTTNSVMIMKGTGANTLLLNVRTNGVNTILVGAGSYNVGRNKIALAYISGNTVLYVNGVQAVSSSTVFTFNGSMAAVNLGFYPGFYINDRIRSAALYTTRLTNEQLSALTKL